MPVIKPSNAELADILEQIADLLELQHDNPYRVQAFRHGAESVRAEEGPLVELVEAKGGEALKELEGIGEGLATTLFEVIQTGRSEYLARLQARVSPTAILKQVPGIGPELANRIVDHLHLTSLEELEQAAHDGRLGLVHGFGPRRVEAVRNNLAGMLGRRRAPEPGETKRPPVALLLELEAEYRRRAEAGELKRLAPRRFNPSGEAWLPIMQVKREDWSFTLLYSNTARAHELGLTRDWVVIYYQPQDGPEAQGTVVTETKGPLAGKRVVRGREKECREYYGVS